MLRKRYHKGVVASAVNWREHKKERILMMKDKALKWLKNEMVLVIAGAMAIVSMLFVMPSYKYAEYFDYRVLV